MERNLVPDEDVIWAENLVVGVALLHAEFDSSGNSIEEYSYYQVGKHLPSGKVIILLDEDKPDCEYCELLMIDNPQYN